MYTDTVHGILLYMTQYRPVKPANQPLFNSERTYLRQLKIYKKNLTLDNEEMKTKNPTSSKNVIKLQTKITVN